MAIEEFDDIGFDIAKHREALPKLAELGIVGPSLKAALRAREAVTVHRPTGKFRISVSEDLQTDAAGELQNGCTLLSVIHHGTDPLDSQRIRRDVERYFLRHFPGRTVRQEDECAGATVRNLVVVVSYSEE